MKQRRLRIAVHLGLVSSCLLAPAILDVLSTPALAQVTNGTISGTVTDTTGAVIPHAPVVVTNQATGSKYSSRSNGSGLFSFTGLPSGDFTVTITAPGFQAFTETGVHLDPGDSRSLPNLKLAIGGGTTSVTVEAQGDVPLDTGEKSDLITAEQIKHLSVEGRDVTELLKTLPGFAIATQTNSSPNNGAYDPSQVNITGAIGSYAANGNIATGNSLKLDGANITDPGGYGASVQNINYDQVAEVKVDSSNFGADEANGPVVIATVSKSGTDHFHGELYTYARTSQLDSSDALNGPTNQAKDPDHEVYPGFNVGGPVLIPGTRFNHNRNLTFFAGAEDYAQRDIYAYGGAASALVHSLVPTAAMRQGNYSASELQNYLGPTLYANAANLDNYGEVAVVPTFAKDGTPVVGGQLGTQYFDPGYSYIASTFPLPNNVPTLSNPFNWQSVDYINDDLYQVIARVDLAISERNHFFARCTTERGASGEPAAIYYNPPGLNTPGGGLSSINSESAATNLTTIISPTLTNQVFANLIYLDQAFVSGNPSVLANYPYQGAFANGRHPFPMLTGYTTNQSGGLPLLITPDYTLSPLFSHKFIPEAGDNLTKVLGKHTVVAGVYGERITNNQKADNINTNGNISNYYLPAAGQTFTDLDGSTPTMSGNWVADNYEGFFQQYGQQNILPDINLYFWNNDFFVTDSWKVIPRLTLNLGVRFEHDGLWNDAYGNGVAIFNPALITSGASNSPYPGFLWHKIDPSLPTSGVHSADLYTEPRVGFAWDVLGTGKTVIRGGWGEYRGHDSWNSTSTAVGITQNTNSVFYGSPYSLAALSKQNINPGTVAPPNTNMFSTTGTEYAVAPGDNQQPLSDSYSLNYNQVLPKRMIATISYVGDNSRFLINGPSATPTAALSDVNAIPIGGLYRPNPITGQVLTPTGLNPTGTPTNAALTAATVSAVQLDQYRPLNTPNVQYADIEVLRHNLYANYNGLQMGVARQTGRVLFNVNYTFSKALGVRGAGYYNQNGTPGDPFNLSNDYGTESFDRRHIFNATYTFEVGTPVHNKFAGGFVNGWELSGITSYQAGADISSFTAPNLGVSGFIGPTNTTVNGTSAANPNQIMVSSQVYLGTPDVSLQPTVTCSPRSGLGPNQYINGNCFGLPNLGQNGQYILPRLTSPAYFDSDLSAQKAFTIPHGQSIIFRLSAFNFVNHPLTTLTGAFPAEYQLNFTNPNSSSFVQTSSNSLGGFGTLPYKTGRRVVELMAKYTF